MAPNTKTIEVLFSPAEYAALAERDLADTVCVVFDIFRATSTIVTALAHGACGVIPVAEIPEAIALRRQHPGYLLAGERGGVRIGAALAGGTEFDLGNSPREFTAARMENRTIVLSTTNGSRALRACAGAGAVLAGSFLNLAATARHVRELPARKVLLVCSGTADEAAYEDALGAGALADLLWPPGDESASDSASIARQIFGRNQEDLPGAVRHCRNGRRLLNMPELRDDVPYCLQRDIHSIVASLENGKIVIPRPETRPAAP